ncbi:Manganese transporter pdt1 [Vanrija pseudolonga]|uniref:Manganese transporter pdt1 n=1 Tax=Vanrija pseudolonga TaxID=143232 RepID=A0AAF0Y6V5_9TREE|nr:Manganese transporter pdt1 [Vanrija pseudolonga]
MTSLRAARAWLKRHLCFIGPGLVAAVAYVDPGNWATDLQAGAEYGYKLLFIVFVAGVAAVILQILSVRLGAVTSQSLPQQTRALFLRWEAKWPKYRRLLRLGLWTLWALAEIAIIATDLAELLGSAIALNLLFPRLPLWAGVLITAVDVLVVLLFFRSNSGRQGMMFFEIVIVSLVLAVFVSFAILLHLIKPEWREVFLGLVPSKTLFKPGALYLGVGIIGATVMPHALFLGSSLATVDRLGMLPVPPSRKPKRRNVALPALNVFGLRRRNQQQERAATPDNVELAELPSVAAAGPSTLAVVAADVAPLPKNASDPAPADADDKDDDFAAAQKRYEREVRAFDRIDWVRLHVNHASVDTIYSLFGFALTINSAILTLAGAAFYYSTTGADKSDASLFGAHALLKDYIGNGAAIIFALALLCAGQSASITATLAGQIVSEGFLEWRTSPFVRRLITRLIGVIPATVVAIAVGPKGMDDMLVASQVILSIVLPTVTVPLVYLCSQESVMGVDGPVEERPLAQVDRTVSPESPDAVPTPAPSNTDDDSAPPRRRRSFTSPKWLTGIGYLLCFVVILANGYVIVELALGNG